MTRTYENYNWDYTSALNWMGEAREHCRTTNEFSFGIGAHSKDLVSLGRHAKISEVINTSFLASNGIDIVNVDRGGGATIHGPGQIVLYPIISLSALKLSVPKVTYILEESIIQTLNRYGILSHRINGEPGVYVNDSKVGSVGFRVSESVLTHGISLNVCNNLDIYSNIRTCGKTNAAITSIAALLGEKIDVPKSGRNLMKNLGSLLFDSI